MMNYKDSKTQQHPYLNRRRLANEIQKQHSSSAKQDSQYSEHTTQANSQQKEAITTKTQLDSAINIDSANPVATRFNVQNKGELNSVKA